MSHQFSHYHYYLLFVICLHCRHYFLPLFYFLLLHFLHFAIRFSLAAMRFASMLDYSFFICRYFICHMISMSAYWAWWFRICVDIDYLRHLPFAADTPMPIITSFFGYSSLACHYYYIIALILIIFFSLFCIVAAFEFRWWLLAFSLWFSLIFFITVSPPCH